MKTMKLSTKIKALEDELAFCMYKLQGMHPLEHWSIRAKQITKELKTLKKGTTNVKTKTGKRKAVR